MELPLFLMRHVLSLTKQMHVTRVLPQHLAEQVPQEVWQYPSGRNTTFMQTSVLSRPSLTPTHHSAKIRSSKTSSQNKRAYNIISIGALLKELGQRLITLGWELGEDV